MHEDRLCLLHDLTILERRLRLLQLALQSIECVKPADRHVENRFDALLAQPIDYIAIGPVFTTTSKTDPDPALGLEGIREVRRRVGEFPLIAIGGITLDNAPAVFDAGADSVALISALLAYPSQITAKTVQFLGLT